MNARRPRVCFIADSLVVGGAERVIEALATGLPREGFETSVFLLRAPGPVGDALIARSVDVRSHLLPANWRPDGPWRLRNALRAGRADLVHVLDHSNALLHGRVAARMLGLPQVCAVHRTRRADGSPSLGRLDRALMGLSDRVLALSAAHAEHLRREGVSDRVLRVVANGIDTERLDVGGRLDLRAGLRRREGIDPDALVLIHLAALRPEKNHELSLDLLATPGLEEAHLLVVGGGPREAGLRQRALRSGVAARVHWLGVVEDVGPALAAADLMILPSHPRVETFPLSILEGMAAALPVVSTRVGSVDEIVLDGRTGCLCPPDEPGAFAEAVRTLAENPRRRRMLGRAGRERVRAHFDSRHMVAATAEVFRELLRQKRT